MSNIVRNYILLYRISDGFWDFIMSCFVRKWTNPLKYHMCEYCEHVGLKHPLFASMWHWIIRKPWYCDKCAYALAHTKSCRKAHCTECAAWREYLMEESVKGVATRWLRKIGLGTIAVSTPEREGGWG